MDPDAPHAPRPLARQRPRPGVTHLAIGVFDGVHRGHQAVIASMALRAGSIAHCGVLTFEPHPLAVIAPARAPERLTTAHQRVERLRALGVGEIVVIAFDPETRDMEADDFVAEMARIFPALRSVTVGPAWAFGKGRQGNAALLRRRGWLVEELEPLTEGGQTVSSTRIRAAIARGDLAEAALLLGREYEIEGHVVTGEGRGRTLGIPTANLGGIAQLLPPAGVYACHAAWTGGVKPAVVNIGRRPTFHEDDAVSVEAHLLDFSGDLYGKQLALRHLRHLRDERKFPGIDALKEQIAQDIAAARALLAPDQL